MKFGLGQAMERAMGSTRSREKRTTVRWTNRELRTQQNAPILIDDYLFGFDGDGGSRAALKCVHRETGEVAWEEDTFKYGALSAAGDHLIVLSAQGELIIAPCLDHSL